MALVKNSVLMGYSGRIGNHVYRVIKGKTYVSIRPMKYRASKSPAAKRARSNFGISVKLAASVNSLPGLRKIWDATPIEGYSPYHKIISGNSSFVKEGNLTLKNIITPGGLYLELSDLFIQNNMLNIQFNFSGNSDIKFPVELYYSFGFNELKDPVLSFAEKIEEQGKEGNYNLSIPVNAFIKKGLEEDPHPMIYVAVAGAVPRRKKIYWSETAAVQI